MHFGIRLSLVCGLVVLGTFFTYLFLSPVHIEKEINFTIEEGETLLHLSNRLYEKGIIRSPLLLRTYLSFNGKDTEVQLGEYVFSGTYSLVTVAEEITERGPKNPLLSVTIPEGSTSLEVFQLSAKVLPALNKETFMNTVAARNLHGKLFPSTYYLLPSYREDTIISLMEKTYTQKVDPLFDIPLPDPLRSEYEVLILASILEGEANTEKDMKMVAGILLERMRIGMPLQVDVAMETYRRKGLPEIPINNPGVMAINAVLYPTPSPYLYYITGNDGNMYYAKTYNEHKRNIQKYLR